MTRLKWKEPWLGRLGVLTLFLDCVISYASSTAGQVKERASSPLQEPEAVAVIPTRREGVGHYSHSLTSSSGSRLVVKLPKKSCL